MKNFLILCICLIGLFAVGCSSPPSKVKPVSTQTSFVQAADMQVQAYVINAVDEAALPAPDTPAPVKWVDENLLLTIATVLGTVYEFLVRKIPTSKTLSLVGNAYKLINYFIPDKSKNGGTLTVRDKL